MRKKRKRKEKRKKMKMAMDSTKEEGSGSTKQLHALQSFARDNSPFARDVAFLPTLENPKFRRGAITLETILELHKGVMEADGQNEAAGQLRTCNVSVGKHRPIDHSQVEAKMLTFVHWLDETIVLGEKGARAQHRPK
uniref:Uncharacterized protein n=1 Tax=Globodera rostochiensis TaxID=31243 RepID=A0A914GYR0_GLORO